ncbi:MAG TPA: branched-chain amino acid ABC transporter permease [Chloroflexi bacterium]|nr:branched-chain amino acid ABC transporter permease [Chloroflexota bacterium]
MTTARSEFFKGIKAELPILIAVIPFGMIYGVLSLDAGLSAIQTQAMSVIVFAGSAQFIMAQLFATPTPALVIIITALLVNLRHALYSASVYPYIKHLPFSLRSGLAYLLTDEAYAVSIIHYNQSGKVKYRHWFFLGAGLAMWSTWQLSTAAGILIGSLIPTSWPLEFFIPLTFIALVVPSLKDWPSLAASLTGGLVSVVAFGLPFRLGLIVAAFAGIGAGLFLEEFGQRALKIRRAQHRGDMIE